MHDADGARVLDGRLARLHALAVSCGVDPSSLQLPVPFEARRAATSYMQRRLWFVEKFQGDISAYHVPAALRLSGAVDLDLLERAIQRVVDRHDALRTTLVDDAGVPVMAIAPSLAFRLDVRPLPPCDEIDALPQFVASSAATVRERFDLAAAPPWRAAAFTRGTGDVFLLFVFHHTIFDGWSIDLLFDELASAYEDEQRGIPAQADPERWQYPEFAAWQHARAAAGAFDADVEFWVRTLTGAPGSLNLRGDRDRSLPAGPVEGHIVRQPLDPSFAKRLVEAGLSQQATPFAAGLALWCAWLRRQTGNPDLVIGTPSGGRSMTAFESIVGPCINTLALRLDTSDTPTYAALVRQARQTTLDAGEHEYAPIDRVLNRLRPGRVAGRTPIVQTSFTAPVIRRTTQFGGLAVERVFPPIPGSKSEVALEISRRLGRWSVSIEYNAAIFSPEGAREALEDFLSYSDSLLKAPDRPLVSPATARAASVPAGLPLTPSQLRMWIDQARSPLVPIYNLPVAIEITGAFDEARFDRAFARLVAAHDALRLTFSVENGEPRQRVSGLTGRVTHLDLTGASDIEREQWLERDIALPFDLSESPVRCTLARFDETRRVCLFVQHHIVGDGTSTRLLVDRLSDLYARECRGDTSPVSYPSFAAHAAKNPGSRADDDASAWWDRQFDGVERPRFFGVRTEKQGTRVTRTEVAIQPRDLETLLSSSESASTMSPEQAALVTCASALAALLYRMTGEQRVGMGMPCHNRRGREERAIAGPFMDVLPIAIDCLPDDTLGDVASRVMVSLRQTLRHARTLPSASVRERGCDVILNVQTITTSEFCGQTTRPVWLHPGHERESLSLQVQLDRPDRATVHLDTHDDVFDPLARARMVARFARVLSQAINTPDMCVADLQLVDDEEMRATLEAGCGRVMPDACRPSVIAAIAARAAAAPGAIAVEDGAERVTYGELIDRAARVAARLAAGGIVRGDVVGVCLPRSIGYVTAILGVLGAGAAYLPIDPAAPEARRAACLAKAGARHVIADTAPFMDARPMPFAERVPGDLAYVIFTSGSTGEPKGVEITDGALANYTRFAASRFGLTEADRALQFAALTFDTAVEEIFPTLLAGATLVLRDDEMLVSPGTFTDTIGRRAVSVVNLPTSYWHVLAAAGACMPACTRLVIVGGEEIRRDLLDRWQAANGTRVQLLNGYGPTEGTIVATMGDLAGAGGHAGVSIGGAIWNAEVRIVDRLGRIAPIGHAGELMIGGAGLARGYRNDPAATAARFVPHPLTPGARLYRTGDRARMRSDGSLEFLGRLDDQIKIRGYRVEPGEIEARLREHPSIADAAITASHAGESTALRAFLVSNGRVLSAGSVRAHLRERLPEYMVPHAFLSVPEMPRTSSGKPDRARLASMATALEDSESQAPETPLQRQIAAVWNAVLRRASTGIHDNFFDVGGHSLLATQVVARLSSDLHVRVPLRAMFDCPTIATLAEVIEHELTASEAQAVPAGAEDTGPFPLSFGQERLWFAEQLLPGTHRFTMPSILRLTGGLDVPALQRALDTLVDAHASLRTRFFEDGGVPFQRVDAGSTIVLEHTDLAGAESAGSADAAAREFLGRPFNLTSGQLVRAGLIRVSEREHWLMFAFHHLIFDGWSGHILVEDLSALYAAECHGVAAGLRAAPGAYASFVRWQRQRLNGSTLEPLLQYWRERLAGLSELRLQPDADGGESSAAGVERVTIDAQTVERLTRAATGLRATPFIMSSAALAIVLSRWSGQDDVVFGLPVAGRTRPEFERTVGLFLNTLPLRLKVSGADTVATLIANAREAALGAFAHQDLPFDRLVEELAPERSASRQPFFDVVLNFVNTPQAPIALDGLDITPIESAAADAKYPLTIYVVPLHGELALRAVYMRALFNGPTIQALLEAFASVLCQLIDAPSRLVDAITLITDRARQALPDPAMPLSLRALDTVAEQFARVCIRTPDAVAIDDRGECVTYAELGRAAAGMQRRLGTDGVAPGAAVAITGAVTSQYVAALLGVMGSGRIAVPIDPATSTERRTLMAAEASVSAWIDADSALTQEDPEAGFAPVTGADHAYIVFTSGTAGVPKAVLGSHRGLAHFVAWERDAVGVTPNDRVARVTSPAFDVFLREVFVPLTAGASLHIGSTDEDALSERTLDWFDRAGVTVVHAVPTLAHFWMSALPSTRVPSLRCTLFAGEALLASLVERWRAAAPHARVINLYGPTETTLAKCWHDVPAPLRARVAPIGRAIDGAQALVLRGEAPCGIGEAGEIVIRTAYRSHGYLNQSAADSGFVANPFTTNSSDLLYRTGDRGYYLADGTLAILGRMDDALKIRGVRVNTTEVAAVLATHARVQAAAVVADVSREDPRLVACVIATGDVTSDALRKHVERRLSSAARPSQIVFAEAIPRTSNGKVDRQAVLALANAGAQGMPSEESPTTMTEQALAPLWCELLGCERVRRGDDFFDLGGHSLLTARLVARIRATFGVELAVRTVFDLPTLAGLASAIDHELETASARPAIKIPRADRARYRTAAAVPSGAAQ